MTNHSDIAGKKKRLNPFFTLAVSVGITSIGGYFYGEHRAKEARIAEAKANLEAAEAEVRRSERDFRMAEGVLDDVLSGGDAAEAMQRMPRPRSPIPPDLLLQMKHAVELNEMFCRTEGMNCELARVTRRQYEENIRIR